MANETFISQVREILQSLVLRWIYTSLHRNGAVHYLHGFHNLLGPLDWVSSTPGPGMWFCSPDASSHGPTCLQGEDQAHSPWDIDGSLRSVLWQRSDAEHRWFYLHKQASQ